MWFSSRHLRAGLSAIVPGLGQLVAGRWVDAFLFGFAMLWVRGFLAGFGEADRLPAALFGAPAIDGGLRMPVVVVFTAILGGLHALSAWDAGRQRHARSAPSAGGELESPGP